VLDVVQRKPLAGDVVPAPRRVPHLRRDSARSASARADGTTRIRRHHARGLVEEARGVALLAAAAEHLGPGQHRCSSTAQAAQPVRILRAPNVSTPSTKCEYSEHQM
jgi:hypothetical protein